MEWFATTVCLWKKDASGAVSLTLDGAYLETYHRAVDALLKHGMPATWFVVTGAVGKELEGRSVAGWEALKTAFQMGMELASHTVTHPDLALSWPWLLRRYLRPRVKGFHRLFTPRGMVGMISFLTVLHKLSRGVRMEKVLEEAMESRQTLEQALGLESVVSFAYPGGRYDSNLMKALKSGGFLSARSVDPGYNAVDSMNLFALKSKLWDIRVTLDEANRWADYAVENKSWLVETYHVISQSGTTGYYWDTAASDFDQHLSYISGCDLWVDTQERVTKYILQRQATRVWVHGASEDEVQLYPESHLSAPVFGDPLTFRTMVPPSWKEVVITQANRVQTAVAREAKDGWAVTYDVSPHDGALTLRTLKR